MIDRPVFKSFMQMGKKLGPQNIIEICPKIKYRLAIIFLLLKGGLIIALEQDQPSKYPKTGRGESENNGQTFYNGILPSSELSCFSSTMITLWAVRRTIMDVDIEGLVGGW